MTFTRLHYPDYPIDWALRKRADWALLRWAVQTKVRWGKRLT